ncbi:MAG: extracellular solute-binding protein [Kiritimatiellae bacterium]|nr:extracellular solute-binding protein [Kiritimatiellia bacterium]
MIKNCSLLLLAALVCALPFALRPAREAGEWREGDPILVVVSPHIASIREEFARGFSKWHAARFGRPVQIDWRNIGGTTEIMRYLQGEYDAAYRAWRRRAGLPPADGAFAPRRPADPAEAAAWDELRAHDDPADFGCKIDVFFGGGTYDHGAAEAQGLTVPPWPDGAVPAGLFEDADGAAMIPEGLGGEVWRGTSYFSAVLSGFGICSNPDRLVELGITNADGTARQPRAWRDLADPRLVGQVAVTDPTKSGSIAKAFEMILHSTCRDHVLAAGWTAEQIAENEAALREGRPAPFAEGYQAAVEDGWLAGIRLLQRIGANARYFTDAAGKPPQDVSAGDAAAGVCIDFYGRVQAETTRTADGRDRLLYVTPRGGSSISGDPISLLRGAEHRELGARFIEFVLSEDGQKLWNGRPGTPGGPEKHALRRLPIRRDFYPDASNPATDARARARAGTTSDDLLDPAVDAYELAGAFTYEPRWTAAHFSFLRSFVRAMCMDSGEELREAWRAILAAGGPGACPEAMRLLERLPDEPYEVNWANVTAARKDPSLAKGLSATDLQTEWTKFFRRSYAEARAAAEAAARATPEKRP